MTALEEYYKGKLYPLMDGFLKIIRSLNLPFYLTGGTALSRHYLQHRYSDDLDLFVNNDPQFTRYLEQLYLELQRAALELPFYVDTQSILTTPDYQSFFLIARTADDNIRLKVDLVNDRAPHYGEFAYNPTLGQIDSWRNMLSNKLTALYRYEPKDVIDIWMIARHFKFDWREIIAEAKTKDAAVDPIDMAEIISSLPTQKIETIKFITPQSAANIHEQLQSLAEDIFYGRKSKGLN